MASANNAIISLVLSTVNQGKKETMSITNINPVATNQQIIDFTDMLMNFSVNNLTSVSKVTKEEVFRNG